MTEWEAFGYPSKDPCEVCGKTEDTREEPRFLYIVCEEHSALNSWEIWHIRERREYRDRLKERMKQGKLDPNTKNTLWISPSELVKYNAGIEAVATVFGPRPYERSNLIKIEIPRLHVFCPRRDGKAYILKEISQDERL